MIKVSQFAIEGEQTFFSMHCLSGTLGKHFIQLFEVGAVKSPRVEMKILI